MPLNSMTGFARVEGIHGAVRWHWELRSVNGKGLDARLRLPPGMDGIEQRLRTELARHLKRGNCQINLVLDRSEMAAPLRVNRAALAVVMEAIGDIQKVMEVMPPRPEGILALKGVLENAEDAVEDEDARTALEEALVSSFTEGVKALASARAEEGAKLETVLTGHVNEIERLTRNAEDCPAAAPSALQARLKEQLQEMLGDGAAIAEDRVAQEAALLATRADIREEIDRLKAHVEQARELLSSGEAVGRRLDFLTQEFNREANTLCSKAADVILTRIGLDLKAVIDQFREQIQNVE
ncbi:YicC/YloC family endoribonuclease [Parvibaculum sp.]|uniref:YicC/YloC family endoribonuclease n=1 Tax=Parvibaculum sp. TaxID=2024848 RepID=UPI000EEDE208|nr:YicC/YloC family endoribonuclease [Parvibaculum sp.]MBO6667422.1 YicC family protein [Parvibaculum sp.]MBO6692368.1 YicC family protein [Parvibaculum sp.]MBO6713974.1 YicC family protein [Parvibaculum sp.]HAC60491.1 YicC family protein [Rhodobiaceae bacterium]